jgi:Pyridine nucleotide-disulphide oxidoreductase
MGIDFRIFGRPMHRWLREMPSQMLLKSEGCASNLADPAGHNTLSNYCISRGLTYSDYVEPVSREVFAQYGLSFQERLVPALDNVMVRQVTPSQAGFQLQLSSGEILETAKVVVATGMDYTAYTPTQLANLPSEFRSHSSEHYDLSVFKGKEVIVLGGGQSALETAAILRQEGAFVTLVVRAPTLAWNRIPSKARRSLYQSLRYPRTRLGDGLQLWLYDSAPRLFHYLPQQVRFRRVEATLGPAGAWWLRDRVVGQMPILVNRDVLSGEVRHGRVLISLDDRNGGREELAADHVIAATGYQFELHKLPFLCEGLKNTLRQEQRSPILSSNFESSVAGLYFAGFPSTNSFGPVMRFVAGTGYAARRISLHIARDRGLRKHSFAQQSRCPNF